MDYSCYRTNLQCPKCKHVLYKIEDKYICPECLYNKSIESKEGSWYELLRYTEFTSDVKVRTIYKEYPSIIAHELWRIDDLLEKGQTYGVLLQIKDLFEILIKFPILIAISYFYYNYENQTSDNIEEKELLSQIIGKKLSLGDWNQFAIRIKKHIEKNYKNNNIMQTIKDILKNIILIYNDSNNNIVKWRNEYIGHGALGSDTDSEFIDHINQKLKLIKNHLCKCEEAYLKISPFIKQNETKELLIGRNKAKELDMSDQDIYITIKGIDEGIKISPYIILRDRGIYFFDSYSKREELESFLNYPVGNKKTEHSKNFTNLYNKLESQNLIEKNSINCSIENETYPSYEKEILDKLMKVDNFHKPEYLIKWLQDITNNNSKGVFMLNMERGTGKSTFIKALDEYGLNKISLEDFWIRAYYINDTYLYKVSNFIDSVNKVLTQDKNGKSLISGKVEQLFQNKSGKKEIQLARVLNFFRSKYQDDVYLGKKKLLFIIDGVDEIPRTSETSILDYIPKPEMLDDGVYVLLTSRTNSKDDRISNNIVEKIEKLTLSEQAKKFYRNQKENTDFLKKYIKDSIIKECYGFEENNNRVSEEISKILIASESRFLYLTPIEKILRFSPDFKVQYMLQGKEVIETYLKILKQKYGSKFFDGIVNILCIIASSYEGLSIKEINYLCGESEISFKTIAYFIDIQCFLKIERSDRGNLFCIIHKDIKDFFIDAYIENIKKMIYLWINEVESIPLPDDCIDTRNMNEQNGICEDGRSYLLAYIYNYIRDYLNNDYKFTDKIHLMMVENSIAYLSYQYMYDRKRNIYSNIINIYEKGNRNNIKSLYKVKSISKAYFGMSMLLAFGQYIDIDKAINYTDGALNTIEKCSESLKKQHKKELITLYADLYFKKHKFSMQKGNLKKALKDVKKTIDYYRVLLNVDENERDNIDFIYLIMCTLDQVQILIALKDIKNAEIELEKIHEFIERNVVVLKEMGNYSDLYSDYLSRKAEISNHKKEDAEVHYKAAAKTLEEYKPRCYEYKLADTYYRIACILSNKGDFKSAIEYFDKSINLYKGIFDTHIFERVSLVKSIRDRGVMYYNLNNYILAKRNYEEAIEVFEKLEDNEKNSNLQIKNSLINMYMFQVNKALE